MRALWLIWASWDLMGPEDGSSKSFWKRDAIGIRFQRREGRPWKFPNLSTDPISAFLFSLKHDLRSKGASTRYKPWLQPSYRCHSVTSYVFYIMGSAFNSRGFKVTGVTDTLFTITITKHLPFIFTLYFLLVLKDKYEILMCLLVGSMLSVSGR